MVFKLKKYFWSYSILFLALVTLVPYAFTAHVLTVAGIHLILVLTFKP